MKAAVCIVLTLTVVIFCDTFAQNISENDIADIEEIIHHVMKCKKLPALSFAIVKNGERFTNGYGLENIQRGVNATAKTRFCIGSLTKAFTSTLLAILLKKHSTSDNKYTWQTTLKDILGASFSMPDEERTKHSSLLDILAHRMGAPPRNVPLLFGFNESVTSRADFVRKTCQMVPGVVPFRDEFIYSNNFYGMAGYIAEKLGNDTWEDLTRQNILNKLGMEDTDFGNLYTEDTLNNFAWPVVLVGENYTRESYRTVSVVSQAAPAGSIISSADDMSKWMEMFLNGGRSSNNETIITAKDLDSIWYPHMHAPQPFRSWNMIKPKDPISDIVEGYGLGWNVGNYRGYRKIFHSGSISTHQSLLWLFPDMRIGVYAALNGPVTTSTGGDDLNGLTAVVSYAADKLLGETPWLNITNACEFSGKWNNFPTPQKVNKTINSSRPLHNYTGKFLSEIYDPATVYVNQTDGYLHLRMGVIGHAILYPAGGDSFWFLFSGDLWFLSRDDAATSRVTFKRDENDDVIELSMFANDPLRFFKEGYIPPTLGIPSTETPKPPTSMPCANHATTYKIDIHIVSLIALTVTQSILVL